MRQPTRTVLREASSLLLAVWTGRATSRPPSTIFTDSQLPRLQFYDDLPRWPNQLPWIRSEDELPEPTVPEEHHDDQPVPVTLPGAAQVNIAGPATKVAPIC